MSARSFLRKLVGRGVVLGVLCAVAAWLIGQYKPVRGMEEWVIDGYFGARGPRPTQAKVVIVALDDASLDQLGKPAVFISPDLAKAVTYLNQQGAAAIGLDLIVPESMAGLPEMQKGNSGDAGALGTVIAGPPANVILAKRKLPGRWLLPLPQWYALKYADEPDPLHMDLAFIDLTEDGDQFIRRQQLGLTTTDAADPGVSYQFALALLATARKRTIPAAYLQLDQEQVPLDEEQCLRINFVGPPGTFPVVPFHDVLAAARDGPPLSQDVRDAIVIIGVTSQGLQDYHETPYANKYVQSLASGQSGLMAGPEVHANTIATLADRAYLRETSWPVALAVLLAAGALFGWLFAILNLEGGALLALALHFGWKYYSLAMFCWFQTRVEVVPMMILIWLCYGVTFGLRWRRLRRMLGVVKSEAIAKAMEADVGGLQLKGESRVVTVLFADVRGFTDFSEQHTPAQVVALLNAYFGAVVPIIEAHGGALNQYMGDGVMVIFGAPAVRTDHALQAVRAAAAMVRRVHELQARWAELGNPTFRIGVGVHTGEVVIGNVGSPSRMDYTAIGDTTNSAARIEAENKRLGSEILISAQTYAALPEEERARLGVAEQAEPALVKGRNTALDLHRVLGGIQ